MFELSSKFLLCISIYTLQPIVIIIIKYPLMIVGYFRYLLGHLLFLFWTFVFLTHTFVLLIGMTGVLGKMAKSTVKILSKKLNRNKIFSKEFDKRLDEWIQKLSNNKYFGKKIKNIIGKIKVSYIKLLVLSVICGTIFSIVGYTGLIILTIKLCKWFFLKSFKIYF